MVNSGDIINYQNEIWLSQEYILKHTGVGYDYLRVAKVRAKHGAQSWKNTEMMNRCYFSYSTLPRNAANKLNQPAMLLAYATEYHDDVTNIVTAALYNRFKMFSSNMSNDVAKSAAVIHEAHAYCEMNGISYSKSQFFERLATEVELQGLKYLPKSWRNLRDKVRDYSTGTPIHELVTVKNEGNHNRETFANNDLIKGWLTELADSQKNFSYAYMWRKIRTICEQEGITNIPSSRWVSDYVSKPEMKFLTQQRFGANTRFNQQFRGYTPTQSALFAGDCWDIDGTRVNIIDHKGTWIDKSGKKMTGQKFLYIIAVRDVMSGNVLGYEYCYEESAQAVINALAMAVRNTGYLPYELRYDRFPGHNTEDWAWVQNGMQRAGVVMTQTVKAEGKAGIERWWGTLQSVFMMESDLYYGEGVKSSRQNAHRSKEYITSIRKEATKRGFNFDDASRETDKIITSYVNTPFSSYSRKFASIDKSPIQLHEESDKPNTYKIEDQQYCYLFGLRKGVSIRNNMIMTQIENATFYYGVDDCDIIEKYTGVKLMNCFDFEDLDKVHLYDDETYLGTFTQLTPAQQFGPDKDMRAVGKIKAIAEKVKDHRTAKMANITAKTYAATEILHELNASEEPMQVSSEVGILLTGRISKPDYEAAESAYQLEEWGNAEEEEVTVNVRNQY
jgi:hypothetical protein